MATRILPSLRRAAPAHVLDGVTPSLAPLPFLPLVLTCLLRVFGGGRDDRWGLGRLGLALDVEDPLDDGDDRPDEDDAEGELEGGDADARPGEDDAERDDHEPDLAGHDADRGQ